MLFPIKFVDIELSQSVPTFESLEKYMGLRALVRLHGVPLGYIDAPVAQGRCHSATLGKLILEKYSWAITLELLKKGLSSPDRSGPLTLAALVDLPPVEYGALPTGEWPLVTVAVCTRDRPEDMKRCLEAIGQLDYPELDILVVDNASKTKATQDLVKTHYPQVRYVQEPRPGLDWARNRAILEAQGEIIAYTDDDVAVDAQWVKAIVSAFMENPETVAVTGLVVPYELETEAQVLFEDYGGFGRGFEQKSYQVKPGKTLPWQWLGGGQYGTGANMAFRRSVFSKIGYFDPALDVGTPTNGGGDLEMFIRVLLAEYQLVYEPRAIIYHRHRREYAQLRRQISFNGSLYALWGCIAIAYPKQWLSCLKIAIWWMLAWNLRRWIIASLHQTRFPKDLINAEFLGAFAGVTAYSKSTQRVAQIVEEYGHQTEAPLPIRYRNDPKRERLWPSDGIAIRQIELSEPLRALTGLENYSSVRIFAAWKGHLIGSLDYPNNYRDVAVPALAKALCDAFQGKLLDPEGQTNWDMVWADAVRAIAQRYQLAIRDVPVDLAADVSVSVVLATLDRPDDLRNCLSHLQRQQTRRKVEIVVIDNNPESGLTPAVVKDFLGQDSPDIVPDIVVVNESRRGLAYARNAGFIASSGDILIATDDDVTVPPDWIENLVRPFARPDVMVVTGNVLPLELENKYQQAFENYGGLGRGFETFEANGDWYDLFPHKPSPTWSLGATANAAFRATMFSHPDMGLMDECLGPGMPSGVGEDTYLFYKVLKAGYSVVYEPKAYVWHKHRKTEQALKKQLYGYSKGHVSYNLTTWLRDRDWRGFAQSFLGLPYVHAYRIKEVLRGRSDYPLALILLEIRGNLAGPWSLWRSRVRVAKEGRSGSFLAREKQAREADCKLPSQEISVLATLTEIQ